MACKYVQEFPVLQMLGLVCNMGMIKVMQYNPKMKIRP